MQINVAQQLRAPVGTVRNYPVSETTDIAGSNRLLEGEIQLVRTERSILAKATLHTALELSCSRCLASFDCPLTLPIEEEYFPTIDVLSGAPLPLPDEPDAFTIDEHNILDLAEAIRQYALMAILMKPLCREDCAGLCPTCGANLNEEACHCLLKSVDPHWSKLLNWAEKSQLKGRK